ncbi:MAG: glycosyltransferase family 2 protein [Bacteroidia bacterium]|jgi:dolichol-phosphate mannosyltransferase|nr:glycosyltransferase family 2 protein [Bacteroidia bacterium]GIV23423.1 MAG: dolichol-phosphate mannosyltransferase [Bacteroidia bacterium]
MELSVIIPVYNEVRGLPELVERLEATLPTLGRSFEVVFVDDGSKDGSGEVLRELAFTRPWMRVILLRRNYGQTTAIQMGIQHATGEVIVLMDSDLENDPADIPKLLQKLQEGYDVVSGWRKERWKGQFFTRKLPSVLANKLISWISGVHLHDYGCTLKAYRREVLAPVRLYGRMHRFIPIYAKWEGGRITEIPVSYHPRKYGRSNYGMMRIVSVLLDLVLIIFLDKYLQRPIQFFGGAGLLSMLAGIGSFLWAVYYKLSGQKDFVQTPLPIFTVLFISVGVVLILIGVLAELLMRVYYEATGRPIAQVRAYIGFEPQNIPA